MCNQLHVHYILIWCFHNVLLMLMLPWQHLWQWQFRHVHSPTLLVVLEVYSTFSPRVPAWASFVHMSGAYLWKARVDSLNLDLVIDKLISNSQSVNWSRSHNWWIKIDLSHNSELGLDLNLKVGLDCALITNSQSVSEIDERIDREHHFPRLPSRSRRGSHEAAVGKEVGYWLWVQLEELSKRHDVAS